MKRVRESDSVKSARSHVAANDADFELPEVQEPKSRALTTQEAANRLGMSVPWVKLHAGELQGRLTRKGYRFPADLTIERVRETVTLRSQRGHAVRTASENEGETAAKVFDCLDRGLSIGGIVKELRLAPEKVRAIYEEWVKCGQIDQGPLAIIRGEKEPPPPPTQAAPGMVSPHGVPMTPIASPMGMSPMPPMPSSLYEEPRGSGLAASMRAQAQAQIAAGDAALDAVKQRMKRETAEFDQASSSAAE